MKAWEYVWAGFIGVLAFTLLGMLWLWTFESGLERDCINAGKTVVGDNVYSCQKIGPRADR